MKRTLKATLAFSLLGMSYAKAQTDSSKKSSTTFTFSADAYYRADFAGQVSNNKTSFTNSNNSFELGMASIKVDHSMGKVAATLDLGYGRRAAEFSYPDGSGVPTGSGNQYSTLAAVKQAYLSFAPSSKIKFTLGKWATHIGYELVDAYANRNYSMSYSFSYGPFSHTGFKADISLGGKSAFMVGIANPTDQVTTTSTVKMFLAQFSTGTKDDKLKGYLNYQGGTDKSQFDLVLLGTLSSKFAINYDGTVCNLAGKNWSSNALYLNFDPSSKFGLTLREEYFSDKNKALGFGTTVFASTLSGQIHIDNLTIIPELRIDNAGNNSMFLNKSGAATQSAGNVLIAAVYKF